MHHLWSNHLLSAAKHGCLGHRNCGQGSCFVSSMSSLPTLPNAISEYHVYIHIHLQIYNYSPIIYPNQTSTNIELILLIKKHHNLKFLFFPFHNVLHPSAHLFIGLSRILIRFKYDGVPESRKPQRCLVSPLPQLFITEPT